jgi:hypothetical protein
MRPNPNNAISLLVDVDAPGASRAWVEHGDTLRYGDETRAVTVPGTGRVMIPVIGLTADATTHLRVHARSSEGVEGETLDLTFRTGPLPAGVPPKIRIIKTPTDPSGYLCVGLYDEARESYVAAMFDRRGKLCWYWIAPPPISPAAEFNRIGEHFLVLDGSTDLFYELDLAGEKAKTWRDTGSPEGLDAHDFLLLPNGNALMIGWEFRAVDSRSLFRGGVKTAIRADHTIDEIDPRGGVVFHWSSYDHVGLDEILPDAHFDATNFQVVHANSLEVLPDGNVLASFRATSSLMKIDRSTGNVVWRLGGKKSDFTFIGDERGGFSHQHDPRVVERGELMLFDNGNAHVPRESRVVRYLLDEAARTATLTWEYHHDPGVFSEVGGSARRLPNGDTLVAFTTGLITEVDESKAVVWEASTAPLALYRALFVPTLYP